MSSGAKWVVGVIVVIVVIGVLWFAFGKKTEMPASGTTTESPAPAPAPAPADGGTTGGTTTTQ
ncbi:MAG: hypothetical protein R3D05_05890 [Dongiaceae bacterium]